MNEAKCVLEIDLAKIRSNYRTLSDICNTAEVAAVVKANSYGLGADIIAPSLQNDGCKSFFVASMEEGIAMRKVLGNAANIFVLNGIFYNDTGEFLYYDLIPVLNNLKQVEIWQECALSNGKPLKCIIHIDTGMNRLGMSAKEVQSILDNPDLLLGLEVQYIASHLSASEIADSPYNHEQLKMFKNYLNAFPKAKASLANSSTIFLGPQYHFDLARPGAALYGINPLVGMENPMQNPVRLIAPIIQLQELLPENYIGYNMTYKTERKSIIATLPLGYADGYPRALSNRGEVYIDKYKAPIVGRISMDLLTIDVTDLPPEKIFLGQEVEIIGNYCTPDKIANIIDTIGYEILTMLGNRYKKVYKNDI